jgi:hypothetical protein
MMERKKTRKKQVSGARQAARGNVRERRRVTDTREKQTPFFAQVLRAGGTSA